MRSTISKQVQESHPFIVVSRGRHAKIPQIPKPVDTRQEATLATCPRSARPRGLTLAKASDILWDCAWEALVLAFLVQIMGSIAIGLVSGIFREMMPSLPPGFAATPNAEAAPSAWDFAWFQQHRFALLFAVFFTLKAAGRLARYSANQEHRNAVASLKRVTHRFSGGWFSLVVANAFTAFIGVLILQFTQQFSLTHLLWQFILGLFQPLFHALASLVPSRGARLFGGWWAWFGDNQLKFTFWLLYSAAICDDLGLPNYKSLGRFLWRRYFAPRNSVPAPSPDIQT
jgi:hypothetical protein